MFLLHWNWGGHRGQLLNAPKILACRKTFFFRKFSSKVQNLWLEIPHFGGIGGKTLILSTRDNIFVGS